jgi:hypothetical protein
MTKKIKSFRAFNDEQSQNYNAQGYPKGKMFANIYDKSKNIYKYVLSLATWIKVVTGQLFILAKNRDIDQVDELLPEWETSVKLPERYPILDTIEKRRIALKRLVSKIPVYNIRSGGVDDDTTIENYIEKVLDLIVEIESAGETSTTSTFPCPFPIIFGIPYAKRQLLLIVKVDIGGGLANNQFPLPFPVQFFDAEVPDATKDLLNLALEDTVPSYQNWEFDILT